MGTGIFEIQRFSEITNRTSDTVITGTDSADSINNLGADKVMVYASGGNDSVKNSGKYVTIYGGVGDDTINVTQDTQPSVASAYTSYYNTSWYTPHLYEPGYSSIDGEDGNDVITLYDSNYSNVNGGTGNDSIRVSASSNSTVNAGSGDDTVNLSSYSSKIITEDGNDVISLTAGAFGYMVQPMLSSTIYPSDNTINGGVGNDTIYVDNVDKNKFDKNKNIYEYNEGDGDDVIVGFKESDTLIIGSAYSTIKSDNDLIFKVGTGSVTLKDTANMFIIHVNNEVIGEGANAWATLVTADNKFIGYGMDKNIVQGTDNADSILVVSSSGDTNRIVYGKGGNDTVSNAGTNVKIFGCEGNDTVSNAGNNVTVFGGNGNDYIDNSMSKTDSSDIINSVILGDNGDDTISNGLGGYTSRKYLPNVTAFGSSIRGGVGNDSIVSYNGTQSTINAGTGDDTIKSFQGSISYSYSQVDYSSQPVTVGSKVYWSAVSVHPTLRADATYEYGKGHDSIYGAAGNDVISLTGNAEGMTINGGAGNDIIYNGGNAALREMILSQEKTATLTSEAENNPFGVVYFYNEGGGDDVIYGFNANDTILVGGSSYSTEVSGNNVIVRIDNGSITIADAANIAPNIQLTAKQSEEIGGSDGDDVLEGGENQNIFVYNSGNDIIKNYKSGEFINFEATYTGWGTDGNDLVINAAEGSIRIQETPNKLVELAGADGNLIAHVFKAENYAGALDGRGFGAFEVIVGSDNHSNQIYANNFGSSLWGGRGNSNDDLYGGGGFDEFIYTYGNGQDNFYNAGSEDVINLLNVSIEQIVGAQITDNGVTAQFADGGSINVFGQAGNFKLGGQTFHADYQNKSWY